MSKRVREENEEEAIPSSEICPIDGIPIDVLTHLMAFAWNHTYRMALVSKKFLSVTRSRAFWRLLAQHALKGKLPDYVLNQADFFHGLKPKHGPHGWLWGLLHKDKPNEHFKSHRILKKKVIFKRQNSEKCLSITISGCEYPEFHFLLYTTKTPNLFFGIQNMVTTIVFNNHCVRKDIHMKLDTQHVLFIYVEWWNNDRTSLWCGAIKDNPEEEEWYPLEPFGRWVDAEDVVD